MGRISLLSTGWLWTLSHIKNFTEKNWTYFISENLSYFSQDQDENFGILLGSEGAVMNILYSAKERQQYGEKTAPKYTPFPNFC